LFFRSPSSLKSHPPEPVDPRAALLLLLAMLAVAVAAPPDLRLLLPAFIIAAAAWRYSVHRALLRRLLLIVPMSIGIALYLLFRSADMQPMSQPGIVGFTPERLSASISVLSRLLLISAASLLFGLVVPVRSLVAAMRALHIPSTVVSVAWMTDRFFSVLLADASRMLDAVRARSIRLSLPMRISVASRMSAAFLTRAVFRSERLGDALLARGFDGRVPSDLALRWRGRDMIVCLCAMLLLILIWIPW